MTRDASKIKKSCGDKHKKLHSNLKKRSSYIKAQVEQRLKEIAAMLEFIYLFTYLFIWGFMLFLTLYRSMGSFVGRGNQYIQLVKVLYCKMLTIV